MLSVRSPGDSYSTADSCVCVWRVPRPAMGPFSRRNPPISSRRPESGTLSECTRTRGPTTSRGLWDFTFSLGECTPGELFPSPPVAIGFGFLLLNDFALRLRLNAPCGGMTSSSRDLSVRDIPSEHSGDDPIDTLFGDKLGALDDPAQPESAPCGSSRWDPRRKRGLLPDRLGVSGVLGETSELFRPLGVPLGDPIPNRFAKPISNTGAPRTRTSG
mmetsp:Transcript_6650/g.13482  ORF Transcript_6650/g.13482 Transcript_6650/m.13482 type:complete len:216 (-) Transcript_6650:3591-4238(-)